MRIAIWAVAILVGALMVIGVITPVDFQVPQNFQKTKIGQPYVSLLSLIGIPNEWLYLPGLIYLVIVPLLGVMVIAYGFLDAMNIFPNVNVNLILALLIGLAIIPIGIFSRMVAFLFAFMGIYSTGAFVFLFIFGVAFVVSERMGGWGFGSTREIDVEYSERYKAAITAWLSTIIDRNKGSPNRPIQEALRAITRALYEASIEQTRGNPKKAERILKNATQHARTVASHGGYVPPPPVVTK